MSFPAINKEKYKKKLKRTIAVVGGVLDEPNVRRSREGVSLGGASLAAGLDCSFGGGCSFGGFGAESFRCCGGSFFADDLPTFQACGPLETDLGCT
jgi:hypothetical protein